MSAFFLVFVQLAIVAYAIVGGVFVAFSDFIMRSLARTSGTGGAEAMQVINREVFRWVFMVLFIGLAPVSLAFAVYGFFVAGGTGGALLAAAGLVYFVGCFGVTVMRNVPLNEQLAGLDLTQPSTATFWHDVYVPQWTRWNTLRGAACIVSSGLMLVALPMLV